MTATRWRDAAIDPETHAIIKGSVTLAHGGTVVIRLPYRLESPNKTLHTHWRAHHREKVQWRTRIRMAVGDALGGRLSADEAPYPALVSRAGFPPVIGHRIVTVDRQVPSSRHFLRDRENLIYSCKFLIDQIKYAGFIRDDSMKHITLDVTQRVSEDKRDWTVIRIEVPREESIPLPAVPAARKQRSR